MGRVKAKTEFGTKFDVSLDTNGFARIEKLSFDAYNESTVLEEAVENYKERTGFYPERILVDQIYRTKKNRAYCKEHGIRMSGPKLGRPVKEPPR
ncbi:transposase [Tetragenococcus halophilus]|nr:transposase [Tetragenococcus halophilus]